MKMPMRIALSLMMAMIFALSPSRAAWREASGEHFILYGDLSEAQLRAYAERLERYDGALRMMTNMPDGAEERGNRLTLYIVDNLAALRELSGNRMVAGFYQPSAQGSTAFMPQTLGSGWRNSLTASQVLFHEYAHHILLSGAGEYYPSWVSEGLAEFFMTAQVREDGSVVIGPPNRARVASVMAMNRFSARDLLTSDRRLTDQETEQKYSRGWLLIHYLLLGNERPGQFTNYIQRVTTGTPSLEAATQVFGDLGRLDRDLDRYRRGNFRALIVPGAQVAPGPIAIRELRPGEAAMMPMRMRSARGVDARTAPLLVPDARRVAAAYPADPWVQRALAEIEFDARNNAEAEAAADRVLAIEPNNVMALVYKGRVRIRRAAATPNAGPAVWREARSWFTRANRAEPEFALPLVLFYDSFIRAGQTPTQNAINGLLRAILLVPQDDSLHVRVAREMLRQDNLPAARMAIAPLAYNPHAGPENPALAMLRLIDGGADRAAVLAEVERAEWNKVGEE